MPSSRFGLIGRADGRLTLEDPATGRRVDLESFGPTNAAVFAQILDGPGADAMTERGLLRSLSVDVPCTVDIAQTVESLHAHVELQGIDVEPGDSVLVHDAPSTVDVWQAHRLRPAGDCDAGELARPYVDARNQPLRIDAALRSQLFPGRSARVSARRMR